MSNCFRHTPANSFHVAAYLQCLIFEANSPFPACLQNRLGSTHPVVFYGQRVLKNSRQTEGKEEPITSEMLKALVTSKISDKSPYLSDLRTVALYLKGRIQDFEMGGEFL